MTSSCSTRVFVRVGSVVPYAIIGLYHVAEVVQLATVEPRRWHENAHTGRVTPTADDVIVRAAPGTSGRWRRCLAIGDWRDRRTESSPSSLLVRAPLMPEADTFSGALSRRRSLSPTRFLAWFEAQAPELIQENNYS
jgi:hypothetical protein